MGNHEFKSMNLRKTYYSVFYMLGKKGVELKYVSHSSEPASTNMKSMVFQTPVTSLTWRIHNLKTDFETSTFTLKILFQCLKKIIHFKYQILCQFTITVQY
mmetsp:Transcript_19884/g.45153  ORF Transcript_19884/g.45153 Transcript_19884/m.45153 type:complete len:101 (-) Transcript_19884:633-935(-)